MTSASGKNHRKLVVFGGGRMGLSHAAMAGLLDPQISILIVEPKLIVRCLLSLIVGEGVRVRSRATAAEIKSASHIVIATPPKIHIDNIKLLTAIGFGGRLLVEKPAAVPKSYLNGFSCVMSGYVLKHSYNWLALKTEIDQKNIVLLEVTLETNQDFLAEVGGWRSSDAKTGRVLLEEFGSHCINLILDLCNVEGFKLSHREANRVSFESTVSPYISVKLVANSQRVRKSVYNVRVKTEYEEYHTNFYELKKLGLDGACSMHRTLASEGVHALAYLRGEDFARQMEVFLSEKKPPDDICQMVKTDQLLSNLSEQL